MEPVKSTKTTKTLPAISKLVRVVRNVKEKDRKESPVVYGAHLLKKHENPFQQKAPDNESMDGKGKFEFVRNIPKTSNANRGKELHTVTKKKEATK